MASVHVASAVDEAHRRRSTALLTFGGLLLLLGVLALIAPLTASLAASLVVGLLLVAAGASGLWHAVHHHGARGFWKQTAWATVAVIVGLVIMLDPFGGAVSLTLLLAVTLMVQGLAVGVYAWEHRTGARHGWGWLLAAGALAVVSGLLLFSGLPFTAIAPGFVLGVNLAAYGAALLLAGMRLRRA